MAHRISISIPNELHERIKQYKGELNVSKICQKALIAATDRLEMKESSVQQYDDIVERLRDEFIKKHQDIVEDEALSDAFNNARKVSLETIKEFIEDPSEFWTADPEALFNLYGEYEGDSNIIYESLLLKSMYCKSWRNYFCAELDQIKSNFERAINEVDE